MSIDFTIITVAFNSAATIQDTINSVEKQVGVSVQHIVKDGCSTDQTQEIVRKNKHVELISIRDNGIYHAMNQSIGFISGKYTLFLNSDDQLCDSKALLRVKRLFEKYDPVAVACSIRMFGAKNLKEWVLQEGFQDQSNFTQYPHPAFFLDSNFLRTKKVIFHEGYKISADYRMQLELHYLHGASVYCSSDIITRMFDGGISNSSLTWKIKGLLECFDANIRVTKSLRISSMIRKILR
ncbi:glycosyltransferase [Alphaproteobacteria bacterium]|nr:glycosyltransferase [Alphaproteobacteria bacterium]